jgi:hypothetical protein
MTRAATRLIYVLAASHSGSTLLTMLLGSHPELCTVGELKVTSLGDPERYRCSCGELIRSCPFWQHVTRDLNDQGVPFDIAATGTDIRFGASRYVLRLLRPLHRGLAFEMIRDAALALSPTWRRGLPKIQRANAALAHVICSRRKAKVIVDSSKVGIRLKYLLRNPELDITVVRMVRDGRAVALTYVDPVRFADAKDVQLQGGGMGGDRASERLSMADAAREWRRSNEEAEALLRGLPTSRWTEVRYEALCADTPGTLRRLFAFIGVDPDADVGLRRRDLHVIGNGMRLDSGKDVVLDERWKSTLTPSDLATFDEVAGGLNRRLGYA